MKFDAYWATFWGDSGCFNGGIHQDLFQAVCVEFAKRLGCDIDLGGKLAGGYRETFLLQREGEVVCQMVTNGSGSSAGSHQIRVQGKHSPEVAALVRELLPMHTVSRADVAVDLKAEGVFERLVKQFEQIGQEAGVTLRREGAGWYEHQRDKGRTLYLGSRQSAVMLRLYERGKKLLGEGEQADPNLVRIEVEVKPGSKAKRLLAHIEESALFGCSAWTKRIAELLGAPDLQRIQCGTVWRRADMQRAVQALARQYGQTLMRLRDQLGSADAAFSVITEAMDDDREVREALKRLRSSDVSPQQNTVEEPTN